MTAPAPARFRVLHVCTGNICRSPMAEYLMWAGLDARLGEQADRFLVESAGTWGHTGSPMEPFALRTLEAYGVDGRDFQARELEPEHVVAADLVLGATREHRVAAVVLQPRAAARTFTLREFARLCAAVDPARLPEDDVAERAAALVRAAAANRGLVPPARPRDDDLDDPYHAPEHAFSACGELVEASLRGVVDLLAPRHRVA